MSEHKVGDWAVVDNYGYVALEILRVTEKQTVTRDKWSGQRERRFRTDEILWSGPEAATKALVERLKSSRATSDEEARKAHERHGNRVADLIAKAGADV